MDMVCDGTFSLGEKQTVRRESQNACKATALKKSVWALHLSHSLLNSQAPLTQTVLLHNLCPFSPYQEPSAMTLHSLLKALSVPFWFLFPMCCLLWAPFSTPIPGHQHPLGTCSTFILFPLPYSHSQIHQDP